MTLDAATVTSALEGARALVQADGGDLVVESVDGTTVHMTLVIEGAECAECVMPRAFLEQIALDMVRTEVPTVAAVIIDDPRE